MSDPEESNGKIAAAPKKRSKVFLIILILMVLLGGMVWHFKIYLRTAS